jgi:hypothetical protein
VFGLVADEDDDGNAAEGNGAQTLRRASADQVSQIKNLLNIVRLPEGTVDKWFAKSGVDVWEDMPDAHIAGAIQYVKQRLPADPPAKSEPAKPETVDKQTGEVRGVDYDDGSAFRAAVLDAFRQQKFTAAETKNSIQSIMVKKKIAKLDEIPADKRAEFIAWILTGGIKKPTKKK